MPRFLPPLRLTGARVLMADTLVEQPLALAEGLIQLDDDPIRRPEVDLSGYFLLPGIVDLHGDGFERQILPRPGADFPIRSGLEAYDREAAACGVTTAYMAQGWSWEGGHRGPDHAEALLATLSARAAETLTDLRVQLRVETHFVESASRLLDCVRRHGIDFVVFNDHLEDGFAMARTRPEAFSFWARKIGVTSDVLMQRMKAAQAQARQVPRMLCDLAAAFDLAGVRFGSHDDPDAETREFYAMIGARIAEFPTSRRAAAATRSMGDPVLMGAPNVVRGKSQSGNVAAEELIRAGLCDVLVSDYHLPAMAQAVWTLVDAGLMDLPQAWQMVSTTPARVLGLSDRGRLVPGLRADLVAVNMQTRVIEATVAGGCLAFARGEAALRLMAAGQPLSLAAE